jgi:predicted NUDIX family phosphoesterase
MQVRMCGNYPIYKVKITELDIPVPEDSKQFQYLGWIRNDDNRLSLIQCNFLLFNMQFTMVKFSIVEAKMMSGNRMMKKAKPKLARNSPHR